MEERTQYRLKENMAKERLTVTIEPEILEWIQEESAKDLRTVSNFVEFILHQAMQEKKANQGKTKEKK
jgi:hypothetical protein